MTLVKNMNVKEARKSISLIRKAMKNPNLKKIGLKRLQEGIEIRENRIKKLTI